MDYTVFDVQSYRLDALSELYGIELLHHHNALDDTRACFEILRKFEELTHRSWCRGRMFMEVREKAHAADMAWKGCIVTKQKKSKSCRRL